ncbi:MAG: ATPase [Bacteroidales bacterium]|nr:ATPase [Bacteroidales bacterium]
MKKYSFLIYYKTYNEFLESIQQAGVVHIVEKQKGIPDDAVDLRQQLKTADLLKNNIRMMKRRVNEQKEATAHPINPQIDGLTILNTCEQLKTQQEQLRNKQQGLQKDIENMSVWGDFDLDILKKYEKAGLQINFYSCREREFKPEWNDQFDVVRIAMVGSIVYFITITKSGSEEEPDAEKIRLSNLSLGDLRCALTDANTQIESIEQQLNLLSVEHLNDLIEAQRQVSESIDVSKVHLHTEKKADDKLILLEGWVPEVKEQGLIDALDSQDAYYTSKEPDKDDKSVPILLKNNKVARLFEPIGELYDLPNYYELDLTAFFAPFYMLFFGLCLGDAGYGLLLFLVGIFARPKVKPSMKPILSLVTWLGAATMVCGTISGTFFGIGLLNVNWPWLTSFKKFMLDSDQLFLLALILGAIQIIFGMIIKAIGQVRRYGWAYSLETWGWLILFLGGGGLLLLTKKSLLSADTAKYICYGVVGVAVLFIFLLNTPGRNPFINFGTGLWNTYNMATGLLGDLLSYIRLFALGICGAVLGFAFNDLALSLSGDIPVLSQIIMLVILLIGHSLNIFMSGLGAFVHPMRLTFVEFYKNAGFEGGGKKYKPFKHIVTE